MFQAVFRIRIGLITVPDLAFEVNTDPDQDLAFKVNVNLDPGFFMTSILQNLFLSNSQFLPEIAIKTSLRALRSKSKESKPP